MQKLFRIIAPILAALMLVTMVMTSTRALGVPQNNGALLPALPPQFFNASGLPAANARLCTTTTGTSTPLATYSNPALTSALPNPIVLNSIGQPTTNGSTRTAIYIRGGPYRITLYANGTGNACNGTAVGAQIWQQDGVYDFSALSSFDNTQFCDRFPGSTASAKIAACISALPATGGTADARGIQGAQTWNTDPFTGVVKGVDLMLGAATYTVSTTTSVPSNVNINFGQNAILSVNTGRTLTYDGGITATDSTHFSGAGTVTFTSDRIQSYSPKWMGALCDGSTDDSAAFDALPIAMSIGGVISLPAGASCRLTSSTWNIGRSNIVVNGNGAEILYEPTVVGTGNDRAIAVYVAADGGIASPVNLGAAVTVGAMSMAVASTTGVSAGDWLVVYEIEPNMNPVPDVWTITWVQVASTSGGTVVNFVSPIRKAFPSTHSTAQYIRITQLVENVTIQNLRCRTTDTMNGLPCFTTAYARNVVFDSLYSDPAEGNAFYTFRSSGFILSNSMQVRNNTQPTEIAETEDVTITGNTFGTFDVAAEQSALVVDMGTAPFTIVGNVFRSCHNICMQVTNGARDGSIMGNVFGYVSADMGFNAIGIALIGVQKTVVMGNTFNGGANTSVAVSDAATSGWVVNLATSGNIFGFNTVTNYSTTFGTKSDTNIYIDTFGSNILEINGIFAATRGTAGTAYQAARTGDAVPRWSMNRDGTQSWSDGATADMTLSRSAPSVLATDKIFSARNYYTATACNSAASPAVCGSAAAGLVVIAASTTSVVVNTTAVSSGSQILIEEDSSLGTALGVTCNTTAVTRLYQIIARVASTSFTVQTSAAPVTNPACLSYTIRN